MLNLVLRIIFCAAAGVGCGFAAGAWSKRLSAQRGLEYGLSPKTERTLNAVMAVPGGAVGALTTGAVSPVCGLLLLCICGTVSQMDWTCRIIPNQTVLAVLGLKLLVGVPGLIGLPGFPPFGAAQSLVGFAACFAVFLLPGLFGKKVGAGDIKLAAAMGFLLGINQALLGIAFMGLLVIAYSAAQRKMPLVTFLKTDIPMGPFITVGMFAAFLCSASLL